MSATIYTFPQTAGGRQCLRDHLDYLARFGRPDSEFYVETHDEDWDEVSRLVDDALAFLESREAAQK